MDPVKQEFFDSFRTNFELLKETHNQMEDEIKEKASHDVSVLMHENKFDESQAAVEQLKQLLAKISFDFNFDLVEKSILEFTQHMEALKNGQIPSQDNINPIKTEETTSKKAFESIPFNETPSNIALLDLIKDKLRNNNFEIIDAKEDTLQVFKQKKNLYLTIVKESLSKEEFYQLLESNNSKKNIGFVFSDVDEMEKAKTLAAEWVKNSPTFKTKFLSINFTNQSILQDDKQVLFETTAY